VHTSIVKTWNAFNVLQDFSVASDLQPSQNLGSIEQGFIKRLEMREYGRTREV
jgi:hypothetical protein